MFRFADIEALYLLAVVPITALLYLLTERWRKKRLQRFGNPALLLSLTSGYSPARRWVKFMLLEIALCLFAIMLARPEWGKQQAEDNGKGIEVSVMVDVSNSMYARDVSPDRMGRTQLLLSSLIDELKNDRIAMGVFAGEAYPQLPITNDHVSAKMFVETLTPGMLTCQGTNIAAAIKMAENSFTENAEAGKAIILITDGEDHEGEAEAAAAEAAKQGKRVYVVGVGSTTGAVIPLPDGGVLYDSENKAVQTALNEDMCRKIAEAGQGKYFHLDDNRQVQELLLAELKRLPQANFNNRYTAANEQFQAVGVLLLLVLIMEFFIRERYNHWWTRLKKKRQ